MSIYMGGKLARLSSLQAVVKGLYSTWMLVASGVLQRSTLGDLDKGEKTSVVEFIDDSKMWSAVNQYEGRIVVQREQEG